VTATILACLRRDYLLASSSRLALAWQVVAVGFAVPTLYYLGRMVHLGAVPALRAAGGDYFTFVVVGVAAATFFSAMMGACAAAVRNEQLGGTIETLLVLPASFPALALGVSLWAILVAAGQACVYFALASMVFPTHLAHANPAGVLCAAALTAAAQVPLGMLAAAFVLLFRRPDLLTGTLASVSVLLAGVFYPTSVLPPALRRAAEYLPLTHGLRALRMAAIQGAGPAALAGDLAALLAFAVGLFPVAVLACRFALHEIRRSGAFSA